ncbi:MAG: polyhydroxyalkanoate depolymerase [Rubrivivax sp.]|nr:polyhydroxyalkanoate depolymerase [Rubrivivax sp.]MDP1648387.1 polyhydroxyalkanoate depolymerase [Rubrivivax sp.]
MLYQLYETQRALMAPFSEFASATAKLYSHPLSPFAQVPMADRWSAGFDLMHRLAKEYEKPEFKITAATVGGVEIAVQEQVAIVKPFCRLLRFKRFTDNPVALTQMKSQPTVLVVAPLSGHHSTLLRDTVKALLRDHKVFITDWTDARMVPAKAGPFHLDDYVEYVQEFIRHIGPEAHVISVCQPTVPVLAAVSLMASRGEATPRTMVMMGGPIDARKSPTAVNNLAVNKSHAWFEANVIQRVPANFPGAGRRVYPGFLQHTGFVAMNPDRHVSSHYDYFQDLIRGDGDSAEAHRQFYDEYNAVLDMPAEYYLDTIKTVFQDFALVNGTWVVRGEPVRPQDIITTALLTIEGELDDISGAGQTHAAHELCEGIPRGRAFHYDALGAGHYGIFSGRRWREKVYPEVRGFISRFGNETVAQNAAAPMKRARAR